MGRFNDLTGKKFGKLSVVGLADHGTTRKGAKFFRWRCACDCGGERISKTSALVTGVNISCGCAPRGHEKHGVSRHPLYGTWVNIKQRCYNENHKFFKDYGGRGITVCSEWLNSPDAFIAYVVGIGWTEGTALTVDRKDNNQGYHPENIRVATKTQQSRNQRRNVILEYKGRSASIAEWAEELGVPYGRIQTRIFRGWSAERALTEGLQS